VQEPVWLRGAVAAGEPKSDRLLGAAISTGVDAESNPLFRLKTYRNDEKSMMFQKKTGLVSQVCFSSNTRETYTALTEMGLHVLLVGV